MAPFDQTSASRAVLIEVENVLGSFRNDLVIVGGWVPELLLPGRGHMGSLDVDLAVSPKARTGDAYKSILKRMTEAGYRHKDGPTHFLKNVAGAQEPVKVDFISGQYVGGTKSDSVQIDSLQINSLRGIDLAFEASQEIEIAGSMPDGAQNNVRARIVRAEAYILIKAFALDERTKDKDAYDIAFVLHHYQPSLQNLADRVRPLLKNGLARAGFEILQAKFASIDSVGPVSAERSILGTGHDEEQERRAAFEDAQELFRLVNLKA